MKQAGVSTAHDSMTSIGKQVNGREWQRLAMPPCRAAGLCHRGKFERISLGGVELYQLFICKVPRCGVLSRGWGAEGCAVRHASGHDAVDNLRRALLRPAARVHRHGQGCAPPDAALPEAEPRGRRGGAEVAAQQLLHQSAVTGEVGSAHLRAQESAEKGVISAQSKSMLSLGSPPPSATEILP